jgi:hypothetical protein
LGQLVLLLIFFWLVAEVAVRGTQVRVLLVVVRVV